MKKVLFRLFLIGLFLFGFFAGYKFYEKHLEDKRRAKFYENLVDTAAPTVTTLKDSITIGYQNEKRTIHIYVPPNYHKDSISRYPVIYFLDGNACFNDLVAQGPEWQIDEVINAAYENGEQTAIVIGIPSSTDRDVEYTPWVNEDNPNAHGAAFAKWLTTDLKNWVDTNYRTKTTATATSIGGISRSGMMAYYILMAHPEVIGNAIIQSPSLWVDNERLLSMKLPNAALKDKKIFVSVGSREGPGMIKHAEDIFEKFTLLGLNKDALRYEIIDKEGHWNVTWRKSFALCYPWLMN